MICVVSMGLWDQLCMDSCDLVYYFSGLHRRDKCPNGIEVTLKYIGKLASMKSQKNKREPCAWFVRNTVPRYPLHDDVIKWRNFPRYWPFVGVIHRSPMNSPHKGHWRGTLMFSLICACINSWANNREAVDLRRHLAHYDVIVMKVIGVYLCYH